jgi:hypothetical protein
VVKELGVEFSSSLLYEDVRELARLIQTDQTENHEEALSYAAAAYHKGSWPEVAAKDPTVAGEAAIKAGLRIVQNGGDFKAARPWIEAAFGHLQGDDDRSSRERAMARFVGARTLLIISLDPERVLPVDRNGPVMRSWFEQSERELKRQHTRGEPWDRYGTMACRSYATFEAIYGSDNGELASKIAIDGMRRATDADNEGESAKDHEDFVEKYYELNKEAYGLALSKTLENDPEIHARRLRTARQLVG